MSAVQLSAVQLLDAAAFKPIDIGADRRQHERYAFSATLELSWCEADNTPRSVTGVGVDLSMYGMSVEVPESIAPRTKLEVAGKGFKISSKATVRHCRTVQCFFRLGLSFERTLMSEGVETLESVLIRSLRVAVNDLDHVQPPLEQAQRPRTRWWILRRDRGSDQRIR